MDHVNGNGAATEPLANKGQAEAKADTAERRRSLLSELGLNGQRKRDISNEEAARVPYPILNSASDKFVLDNLYAKREELEYFKGSEIPIEVLDLVKAAKDAGLVVLKVQYDDEAAAPTSYLVTGAKSLYAAEVHLVAHWGTPPALLMPRAVARFRRRYRFEVAKAAGQLLQCGDLLDAVPDSAIACGKIKIPRVENLL